MIVELKHTDYRKSFVKNNNDWDDIDNNLLTGYVVSIKPKSINSSVLVSVNIHIGMNTAQDARWYGLRLYRKVGAGDWLHVEGAGENDDTITGTSCWLGSPNTARAEYEIGNLGNSYLDFPNTTEIVYYTLYWKSRLGDAPAGATGILYINRAHNQGDMYRPKPISSIEASEIWNEGTPYVPNPSTAIAI